MKQLLKLIREFMEFIKGINQAILEDSVSALQLEYVELENAFLTLLFGSLTGIVPLPVHLGFELLDSLSNELNLLLTRSMRGEDVLGDIMSALGGEW